MTCSAMRTVSTKSRRSGDCGPAIKKAPATGTENAPIAVGL
jgi:hypothetical protein